MILDQTQFACRLFHSIQHGGDLYDIEHLLRKVARTSIDLNQLACDGQALVHVCCLHNRLDLLKLFVECAQCDALLVNRDGWLPLHIAVYLGHGEIVRYLIEAMK